MADEVSRRAMIRRAAGGAALVWAAPAVVGAGIAAAAGSPMPGCTVLLETVIVPTDGSVVGSNAPLSNGVSHLLVASGTIIVGGPGFGDAEYAFDGNNSSVTDFCGNNNPNNIDLGIFIDAGPGGHFRPNPSPPPWGAFNPAHSYSRMFVGLGGPITFNYSDCFYGDNSGSLSVQIFACT